LQEKVIFAYANGKRSIVTAQKAAHPLSKAIASISLLAYLIINRVWPTN